MVHIRLLCKWDILVSYGTKRRILIVIIVTYQKQKVASYLLFIKKKKQGKVRKARAQRKSSYGEGISSNQKNGDTTYST
jgi:hypothetical protein